MSDAAQPTAAEVRAAAEAVKTALDRHLAAVERRSGEDDPAVYEAFNELAAAAEEYDELLYDRYDEVTPFEIPGGQDGLAPYAGPEVPNALSVLIRRDYAVTEPQRLVAQAQRIEAAERGRGEPADGSADTLQGAVGVVFGEFDPDDIASRHKEFGLEEGDSTLWITASSETAEPGEWLAAPFEEIDAASVAFRFDVSAVFDEDLDDDLHDLDDGDGPAGGRSGSRNPKSLGSSDDAADSDEDEDEAEEEDEDGDEVEGSDDEGDFDEDEDEDEDEDGESDEDDDLEREQRMQAER
ncbi:hypothetical protein HUT18_03940 [Streptomyces sp. NA04227]|uniref:hypothetical protein n=1 Tax=Streptomyces sp. NA04227 TaxID=2742136 RepID=UPI0015902D75|nr:hypothetical protein [Streptomyces sp. NA04227]QKW05656.1 hypothetical protein HUT18_03940 [Streptomyces sp. NA04227]